MKKPALAIYALLIAFTLLVGCAPLKHPNNFPNSRWICKNPSGEIIVLKTEERNKAPNERFMKLTMNINGEERIFAFPRLAGFDSGGSLRIWSDDPYHEYSRDDTALRTETSMINDSKYIMKITDDPNGIFKGYTELVFERDLEYEKERGIE